MPGEIATVRPRRRWRNARTQYLSGDIVSRRLDVIALGLTPLHLEPTGTWDPAEEYWDEEDGEPEKWARDIIARGPRPEFKMEQVLPGADPDDPDRDPIIESNDPRRLCQLSLHMCQALVLAGNPTEALAFGRRALALVESVEDVALKVAANLYLSLALLWTGALREAEDLLLKVLKTLDGELSRQRFAHTGFPAVTARSYLTLVYADLGRFDQGIACGEEGIRLAEAVDHPYFVLAVTVYLAQL